MDSKSGSVFSLKSQIPTVTSPTAEIPPRFFFLAAQVVGEMIWASSQFVADQPAPPLRYPPQK